MPNTKKCNIEFVSVYPNPCKNTICITRFTEETVHIIITSITGQIVLITDLYGKKELDVAHLHNGIYILALENSNGLKQMIKIVKE